MHIPLMRWYEHAEKIEMVNFIRLFFGFNNYRNNESLA